MSRRDTIIIAALINAGLLIILFVSALKNHSPSDALSMASDPVSTSPSEFAARAETKAVMGDEVDQVLSQYAQQNPMQSVASAPVTVAPAATQSSPNFVDDLKAITQEPVAVAAAPVEEQAPAQEKAAPAYTEVKVKKGDVLEKIARNHHTTVQEIMKANKLATTSLKIGQVLKIPSTGAVAAKTKTSAPAAPSGDTSIKYYTVKAGDNPWTIAVKNHIKVEDLLRLNNMNEDKAKKLKPGDQIRIR